MAPTADTDTCVYSVHTGSARASDSGLWRCEVTNKYGKAAADFSVKVLEPKHVEESEVPRFKETFDNVVVDAEDNAVFKCRVTGKPTPDVRWFRDEIPVEEGRPGMEQFKIAERDGYQVLKIRRATPRDAGVYKCKISNLAGWASCDAKLYVKENRSLDLFSYSKSHEYSLVDKIKARRASEGGDLNEADTLVRFYDSATISKFLLKWSCDGDRTLGFQEHLKSKCAVEGTFAALACLVRGEPPFKVRWFKDNKEIFDGGKYFLKNHRGILSMEIPCTATTDTGNYMCEVRNTQGKIYTSCYLQVEPTLEMTNEVPTKPVFVKPMKRLTVDEGELIRFRVTVKGYPAPGFKWFKDGLEIHDSERITTEMLPNGTAQLVIEHSTVRDIGLYTCEAHNLAGRAKSMVRISVRDKFEAGAWKPRSLGGADVKTEGKYDTPQTGLTNGVAAPKIDYIPRQLHEEFMVKPIFCHALPSRRVITDRGRMFLECCCNAIPRPKVMWFKDDKRIVEGSRYNFLNLGDWFGLELPESLISDTGNYTVKFKNEKGEVTSSCQVEMNLPVEEPRNLKLREEKSHDLSKRSDRQVALQSEETSIYDIAEIMPSCHLCNTEFDWTAFIEKEVQVVEAEESPSFPEVLPDKVTPPEGAENVTLTCKVQGNPLPRVVWFKDGKKIESDREGVEMVLDLEARNAVLTIKALTADTTGTYTCVAYSETGGHATTSTEVTFRDATAKESSAPGLDEPDVKSLPEFKMKLEDTKASVGSQLKLEVITNGFPKPNVQWFKNDQEIKPNLDHYSFENTDEGRHALVISSVHVADADCYRCVAVNECGTVSTCAHVFVLESCQILGEPGERPTLQEPLHSLTARLGTEVAFKCVANGNPVPTFTWQKDSVPLASSDRVVIQTTDGATTLTITEVTAEDAGLYICVAENDQGKVESCSSLQVIGPDGVDVQLAGKHGTDAVDSTAREENVEGTETENPDSVDQITDCTSSVGGSVSAGFNEFDFLKRPKFVARPLSQWVVSNDELYLSVKLAKEEETKVCWYHNGKLVEKGRFKFDVKDITE